MDPNACLQRIRDAIERSDLEEAAYAFDDLDQWIRRGGALPDDWQPRG